LAARRRREPDVEVDGVTPPREHEPQLKVSPNGPNEPPWPMPTEFAVGGLPRGTAHGM
jgi:hypothetical protein